MTIRTNRLCGPEIGAEHKLYEGVCERFESVPDFMNLNDRVYCILSQPKVELLIHFPVMMGDGKYKVFKGYRIQHNDIPASKGAVS
jgi:glutamate dehydrogenase (NAD(P)+)